MTPFNRTPLFRCSRTQLMLPAQAFTAKSRPDLSVYGVLHHNVSLRAVNGRYRATRTAQGKDLTYVEKGIRMADRWVDDPTLFALEVYAELGLPPAGHTLDRIDNDGDYEPGNLRWADALTQAHNSSGRFPDGPFAAH